jgi:hypothetical protein
MQEPDAVAVDADMAQRQRLGQGRMPWAKPSRHQADRRTAEVQRKAIASVTTLTTLGLMNSATLSMEWAAVLMLALGAGLQQ